MDIRRVQTGLVWISDAERSVTATIAAIARLCDASERTVNRWIDSGTLPEPVRLALSHCVLGRILHPRWQHWYVDTEDSARRLWSSTHDRTGFTPTELEQWHMVYSQNRLLWHEMSKRRVSGDLADYGANVLQFPKPKTDGG